MNNVQIEGRFVRDLEKKIGKNGKPFVRFSLLVNDTKFESISYFFNFVAFDPIASQILSTFKKNDFVLVNGRLSNSKYIKDGQNTYSVSIFVDSIKSITPVKVETKTKTNYEPIDVNDNNKNNSNDDNQEDDNNSDLASKVEWLKGLE